MSAINNRRAWGGVSRNDLCHLCESPENIKYFQKLKKQTFKMSGFNILSTRANKAMKLSCSHPPNLPCHPHHLASPRKGQITACLPVLFTFPLGRSAWDFWWSNCCPVAIATNPCRGFFVQTYQCVCGGVCVQSCLDSDPMDHSPPGSSDHGIFQARILEQVAISFSRGASWPKDRTLIFCIGRQFLHQFSP